MGNPLRLFLAIAWNGSKDDRVLRSKLNTQFFFKLPPPPPPPLAPQRTKRFCKMKHFYMKLIVFARFLRILIKYICSSFARNSENFKIAMIAWPTLLTIPQPFLFSRLTLSWQTSLYIETSPLIFRANQWIGFYMIGTSVLKKLMQTGWKELHSFSTCSTRPWYWIPDLVIYCSETQCSSKVDLQGQLNEHQKIRGI